MDKEQFCQFIQALAQQQANQQRLLEHIANQQSMQRPNIENIPIANTTFLPQFEAFD